jgi:hypothetical protein
MLLQNGLYSSKRQSIITNTINQKIYSLVFVCWQQQYNMPLFCCPWALQYYRMGHHMTVVFSQTQHIIFLDFYILLTVHLVMILGKWPIWRKFFSVYLCQFSTCFEQPRAYHQENQLYQYNIWYMSLCVGDRFVCRSEKNFRPAHETVTDSRVTYTRCIDTIDSPDDEHEVARNM